MLAKSDGRVVFGGRGTGKASFSAVLWAEDGVGKHFVGCHPSMSFHFSLICFKNMLSICPSSFLFFFSFSILVIKVLRLGKRMIISNSSSTFGNVWYKFSPTYWI